MILSMKCILDILNRDILHIQIIDNKEIQN